MKLDLQKILLKTNEIYKRRKLETGLNPNNICNVELRSDQVKALAEALVEEINKQLSKIHIDVKRG